MLAILLLASIARANDAVEAFCGGELPAMFQVLKAERSEAAKDEIIRIHRDEVLAQIPGVESFRGGSALADAVSLPREDYFTFLRQYLTGLEAKAHWGTGKAKLVRLMRETIAEQKGDDSTRKKLDAQIDEKSIVSLTALLPVFEALSGDALAQQQQFLGSVCGGDGLAPGGIAFLSGTRKVFAFCPGALLRASVRRTPRGHAWRKEVAVETIQFTAFHEFGHLLGADRTSVLRPMHDDLVTCLQRQSAPFGKNYEDEVLADFWGATALVKALRSESRLSPEEAIDLVAVNLSPFKNGSILSPHHLPFGARQQLVLGEVCRYLRREEPPAHACRFNLSGQ